MKSYKRKLLASLLVLLLVVLTVAPITALQATDSKQPDSHASTKLLETSHKPMHNASEEPQSKNNNDTSLPNSESAQENKAEQNPLSSNKNTTENKQESHAVLLANSTQTENSVVKLQFKDQALYFDSLPEAVQYINNPDNNFKASDAIDLHLLKDCSIKEKALFNLGQIYLHADTQKTILVSSPTEENYLDSSVIEVYGSNCSLSIENIKIDARKTHCRELLYVVNGAHVNLKNGTILTNNNPSHGNNSLVNFGSAIKADINANLTMHKGAVIENCTLSEECSRYIADADDRNWDHLDGTVFLSRNSHFTMLGGEIKNNTSYKHGGAVYCCTGSSFTMKNGSITNNKCNPSSYSNSCGGAIFVSGKERLSTDPTTYRPSSFTMTNGTLTHNTAEKGGALYISHKAQAHISNATITNNSALEYGGGMYLGEKSNISVENTAIDHNSSHKHGGGIYAFDANAVLTNNSSINNNEAEQGAGFFITEKSKLSLEDSSADSNTATDQGGAAYIDGESRFEFKSGSISKNKATYDGAGVYVYHHSTMLMSGGEITENTAQNKGGGINVNNSVGQSPSELIMTGGKIIKNTAKKGGGAFISADIKEPKATISGSSVIWDNLSTEGTQDNLFGNCVAKLGPFSDIQFKNLEKDSKIGVNYPFFNDKGDFFAYSAQGTNTIENLQNVVNDLDTSLFAQQKPYDKNEIIWSRGYELKALTKIKSLGYEPTNDQFEYTVKLWSSEGTIVNINGDTYSIAKWGTLDIDKKYHTPLKIFSYSNNVQVQITQTPKSSNIYRYIPRYSYQDQGFDQTLQGDALTTDWIKLNNNQPQTLTFINTLIEPSPTGVELNDDPMNIILVISVLSLALAYILNKKLHKN